MSSKGNIETGKGLGLFDNPLVDWPNDDVLLRADSRLLMETVHPRLYPVLDWPEVRELFSFHNAIAATARHQCHRWGLTAFALGFSGLIILALSPLLVTLAQQLNRPLLVAAELLIGIGGALGIAHWLHAPSRRVWLANRFWTERLRQYYFQYIVNNIDDATEAMTDPTKLEQWYARRAVSLAEFSGGVMNNIATDVEAMIADRANARTWIFEEWETARVPVQPSAVTDELIQVLRRQRIDVQRNYAQKKTRDSRTSPRLLAELVELTSNMLTVLVMVIALTTGLLMLIRPANEGPTVLLLLTIAAVSSTIILGMRVIDDGLQLRTDAERYEWYTAAVENVAEQFRYADFAGKMAALRELECHAYQELRRFTDAHMRARFLL